MSTVDVYLVTENNMTDIDFSKYNSGFDNPDSRDIPAEDILDMVAVADLPRSCKVADIPLMNQ